MIYELCEAIYLYQREIKALGFETRRIHLLVGSEKALSDFEKEARQYISNEYGGISPDQAVLKENGEVSFVPKFPPVKICCSKKT